MMRPTLDSNAANHGGAPNGTRLPELGGGDDDDDTVPPAWAVVALCRQRPLPPPALPRGRPGRWVIAGLAAFTVVWTLPGWLATAVLITATTALAAHPLRAIAARLVERRLAEVGKRRAVELRQSLQAGLAEDQRKELQILERMVDSIRTRYAPTCPEDPPLVRRLDQLLVAFVDTGIELQAAEHALGMSAPSPLQRRAAPDPEDGRIAEVTRLRTEARARCHERLNTLRRELAEIGELIRLAHEEVLAANLPDAEPSAALRDVVEEVALARQARREVDTELGAC